MAATKPSSRSIRASADGFASHPLFVLIGLPMGSHRSFADTVTSGRPTRSVNRAATSWLLPSVSRTHRGRLPRLSLPSACHPRAPHPISPSTDAATDLAAFRPRGRDAYRSGSSSHSSVRGSGVDEPSAPFPCRHLISHGLRSGQSSGLARFFRSTPGRSSSLPMTASTAAGATSRSRRSANPRAITVGTIRTVTTRASHRHRVPCPRAEYHRTLAGQRATLGFRAAPAT